MTLRINTFPREKSELGQFEQHEHLALSVKHSPDRSPTSLKPPQPPHAVLTMHFGRNDDCRCPCEDLMDCSTKL